MPTERSLSGNSARAILGVQQPHICVDQDTFYFWGGVIGIPTSTRQRFYSAVGKPVEAIFPITFAAEPGLATGLTDGEVQGFYTMVFGQAPLPEL